MADLTTIDNKDDFINRPAEVRNYETFKKEFDEEIHRAADSYVRIGYLLTEARDTGILEGSGYATMSDFAKTEYGLSPDQTSRFIIVYERFGDGEGHLKTEYREHSQTKLIEMLSLPDAVAESIPAELPREEIRNIKQEVKEEQQTTPIERALEESDIPENLNDLEKWIFVHLKNFDTFKKYWEEMKTMSAYDIEALLMMFDQSGITVLTEKIPRRGRMLLSFNGKDNKPALVDVRQDTRTEIEWTDLYTALSYRLYPDEAISDSPEEDYEPSYGPVKGSEKPKEEPKEELEEQTETNFEAEEVQEEAPADIVNEPEAPAEDNAIRKAKNAAKALEDALSSFIMEIKPQGKASDHDKRLKEIGERISDLWAAVSEWREEE